jgi:hypothetical protein
MGDDLISASSGKLTGGCLCNATICHLERRGGRFVA